jgi:hypothetical protein
MNIFFLSTNIKECAQQHVDKHCVKMILEYGQLLSTAHRLLDGQQIVGLTKTGRKAKRWILPNSESNSLLYAATHINHPSAVWARQTDSNYQWLASLLDELCKEYTYRYGKVHKIERDGLAQYLLLNKPLNIPVGEFTEPTLAMPDEFKIKGSAIQSYRNYYTGAKSRMFSWKKRNTPEWIINANL